MKSKDQTTDLHSAPRFHAYLEHIEGRSVMLMPRREWERLIEHQGAPVEIDLSRTPIAALTKECHLEAAVTQRHSESQAVLHVYRSDPKDAPTPINVDRYTIWERLPSQRDYLDVVNSASTEDNPNMRGFLDDYVFLVKEPISDIHWISELPPHIRAVVHRKG